MIPSTTLKDDVAFRALVLARIEQDIEALQIRLAHARHEAAEVIDAGLGGHVHFVNQAVTLARAVASAKVERERWLEEALRP